MEDLQLYEKGHQWHLMPNLQATEKPQQHHSQQGEDWAGCEKVRRKPCEASLMPQLKTHLPQLPLHAARSLPPELPKARKTPQRT